jgi:DNA-binding MarR family transcriptional regulator
MAINKVSTFNPISEETAFRSIIRTYGLIQKFMLPYFGRFGITSAQWGVLRSLDRHERSGKPSMRLTDLGEQLLIQPPSVTGVVDRMEKNGLIERIASPTDLRAKHVRLTAAGRRLLTEVQVLHEEQIATALSGLLVQEQRELRRLLKKLGTHLEELLAPETDKEVA